jgi:hypothetical protein
MNSHYCVEENVAGFSASLFRPIYVEIGVFYSFKV